MDRPGLVFAVVLSLVVAGCAGFGGGGGDAGGRTVNPALAGTPSPSPTPTPAPGYPPGVTGDGVDARLLAAAHDRALAARNSTVRYERTVVAANGTVLSTTRTVIEHADGRLGFRIDRNGSLPNEPPSSVSSFAFWTNGSVTALRTATTNGSVSYQHFPGRPRTVGGTDDSGEELVHGAFRGTDARVVGKRKVDGETLYVLRAERDRLDRIGGPPARNLTLLAYVTDAGVVRSFERRFTATYEAGNGTGAANATVTTTTVERFRVSTDETDAAPPVWVSEARAEAEKESESGSESDGGAVVEQDGTGTDNGTSTGTDNGTNVET